jgi:hypothetical protein
MVTYGTSAIPSDQITVLSGGTVSVSIAFENSIGLMGGMDTANGTANEGEVTKVSTPTDAADKFGEDSELHEAVQLAFQNGAGEIYALPVTETSVVDEAQSSQDGALANAPIFDPRVNEEHSITVEDGGGGTLTVEYVDEPPTSAPSDADTVEIYPPTGEYYADSGPDGTDYLFTYDYGDYSSAEIAKLADKSPRILTVLTESASVTSDLATELNSRAVNFDFMHGLTGAQVNVDPSSYTDSVDERRVSMPYPSRGYTDEAETNEGRTTAAIGGYLAGLALGISSTNDSIGGFVSLKNELAGPSEAGTLVDNQVMPLLDYPPITIVKDMTTSTEPKFERVYAMQVVDEMTELSHEISREFVGDQNTPQNRASLRTSHETAFRSAVEADPKLLDGFAVSVSEDSSNSKEVDVNIGINVVDVMDTVDVTITVGDIIRGNTQA